MIGCFEGIDSERGIDWRCNDGHSLKTFLGLAIDQPAPDHSTISRTRRLIDLETHQEVFQEILKFLANQGLIDGKTIGVDGTTHLAHKAEHAVDLSEGGHGAIVAVNICDAAAGDTATLTDTLTQAAENLRAVRDDDRVAEKISEDFVSEVVLDKGCHSRQTLLDLEETQARSYASEPNRTRQDWEGQADARDAVYANRRRLKGERGKRLLRSRGEKLERTFAHCYQTGGMRRVYLRGKDNIARRTIIHAAGFNIGLLMPVSYGLRKPRSGSGAARALIFAPINGLRRLGALIRIIPVIGRQIATTFEPSPIALAA
jgi:hypothetical protein